MERLELSCTCGATLRKESDYESHLREAQTAFLAAHSDCRAGNWPEWITTLPAVAKNLQERIRTLEESAASLPPTTEPATKDSLSDAEFRRLYANNIEMASITPTTPPSSQSGREDISSGPAEQLSECVQFCPLITLQGDTNNAEHWSWYCPTHGVLVWLGKILVPAAQTGLSTSQKLASGYYVAGSAAHSAD